MNAPTIQDDRPASQADEVVFGLEAPSMFIAQTAPQGYQAKLNAWTPQLEEELRPFAERLGRLSERSLEFRLRAAAAKCMRVEAMNGWSSPAPWEA